MTNCKVIAAAAAAVFLVWTAASALAGDHGVATDANTVKNVNVAVNRNAVDDAIVVAVSVRNDNVSRNANGNSNRNASRNANLNDSTNSNANSNDNTNTNQNGSNASAQASVSATSSAGDGGSSDVNVEGDEAAASGAAPIFLSTGDDTCMGSGALSAQGIDFGVSIASTWTDENCVMLKNARELKNQGYDKAAKMRLCMNDENALAFELAGEPCPRELASTQAAIAKIRERNPDYRVAGAAPAVQVAALGAGAIAGAAPSTPASASAAAPAEEVDWWAPRIEGFLAMVKSVVRGFRSGVSADTNASSAMDGLE